MAIYHNTEPVGFALVGRDECGVDWIDSFMIDGRINARATGVPRSRRSSTVSSVRPIIVKRACRITRATKPRQPYISQQVSRITGEIDADDEVYMLLTHGT